MQKIKVIRCEKEYDFEHNVNRYLADGWIVSSTSSSIHVIGQSGSGCYMVTNDIYVAILIKNSEEED